MLRDVLRRFVDLAPGVTLPPAAFESPVEGVHWPTSMQLSMPEAPFDIAKDLVDWSVNYC